MHRQVGPSGLRAVALVGLLLLGGSVAGAGVAPPRPGEIDIKDVDPERFKAEDIFRIRFPEKMRVAPGSLARCPTCGKPLKDHVDGKVDCRAPGLHAATLAKQQARCPVCSFEFNAPRPDPDPRAGFDHDFCRHPRGIYSLVSEICFCPKCGYATPFGRFTNPVDEDVRGLMKSTVTPNTLKFLGTIVGFDPKSFKFKDYSFLDPAYIPEHLKYENAVAIAGARLSSIEEPARAGGTGDLVLARLHLGASHAYRRLVNRPFRESGLDKAIRRVEAMLVDPMAVGDTGPSGVAAAARRLIERAEAKDALPSEKLGRREHLYLVMRLAGLHDRLGEPWWVEPYLKQAWDLAKSEQEPKVREAYVGLVREIHHRGRALARYRRALGAGGVPPKERLVSVYMVGELLARMGALERARPWLDETVRLAAGTTGEAGRLVASWARARLNSPAFNEGDGAARRLIDADPEEKAFVERIAAGLPVEMPGAAPGGASEEPPGVVTTEATEPSAPGAPGQAQRASPASCREQMERIWRAIDAYRRARGSFPAKLDALVEAGLLASEEAGDFVCVDSAARLFYRAPRAGAGVTFILFHSSPGDCRCKNMLLSDGRIVEFGKWQP